MRLTTEQQFTIRTVAAETFGKHAKVWLFGSRVDDNKRGGDIDLLIETEQGNIATIVQAEIAFVTKLNMQLGEQKIDVLVDYPTPNPKPPIFAIARQTGILL